MTSSYVVPGSQVSYLGRYDNGVFYPHTKYAGPHSVGLGPGAGYSVNIGWNEARVTDTE